MKKIGIFLDHAKARFIDPEKGSIEHEVVNENSGPERIPGEGTEGSRFGEFNSTNNEFRHHRREENQVTNYYKEVAAGLKGYESVLLFGPTTAKDEFNNFLQKQGVAGKLKIESEKSDYMTDNQLVAKVRKHFS